jgi:2-haloacid dehalogenase
MTNSFDPATVKACVFDVFGTVVDWRGSIIREGEERWSKRVPGVDWPAFADAWRGQYGPAMNKVRQGGLGWTGLDTLHRMILDDIAPQFGLGVLSEDEMQDLNKVWHRLHGWPDSSKGVSMLKQHRIVATLSNGNVALLTNMAKFAGLNWDTVLSAELFGHYKPDPEVYLGAAHLLGLQPHEVMMCAAHTGDLDAAAKLGLRTAYIHRPSERPGRDAAPMPAKDAYDIVTMGIDGVATALGS